MLQVFVPPGHVAELLREIGPSLRLCDGIHQGSQAMAPSQCADNAIQSTHLGWQDACVSPAMARPAYVYSASGSRQDTYRVAVCAYRHALIPASMLTLCTHSLFL
eukprot:7871814-Pyramimonas_sp.AAC.1